MKSKIKFSHLDQTSGYSCVAIQNKYGTFWGHSFCSEKDMENYSEYAGERYALLRADKEFAKFRLKQEKIKLQTIQNLLKDIEYNIDCPSEFLKDNPIIHRINLKLRDYTQSVQDWQNLYDFYEPEIRHQDKIRQDILSKVKKK